jgi:quercetin dioxygenase-like cupin family protein
MKIQPFTQTEIEAVEEAPGVAVRWVIDKEDGAPNFAMRVFDVEPGANTPYHTHSWEHEVFILEGEGAVNTPDGQVPLEPEYVVYVGPEEKHQFINTGEGTLRFICLIPHVES